MRMLAAGVPHWSNRSIHSELFSSASTWGKLSSGGATLPLECRRGDMEQRTPTESRNFTSSSTSYPQARSKPPGRFFEYLARHQEDDET